jgi:predicted TIM-barrel fold metal-dependent hydrolase
MAKNRIDVHHHFVTEVYSQVRPDGRFESRKWISNDFVPFQALEAAGGDPSGSWTPQWNLDSDDAFCRDLGIGTTIFSLTSPGAPIAGLEGSVKLARGLNDHLASIRDKNPLRYGFFATMPDIRNVNAALAEIAYAFDTLKADGVILLTRYGPTNMYLGNEAFTTIWAALNARKAVVLVHPTHSVDTNLIAKNLPQPIVDYPHETTRTAADIIMANVQRNNPEVKIILAHGGGGLPYIAKRLAVLGEVGLSTKTVDEVLEDVGNFYYDVALSSTKENIELLLSYTKPDHLLYGSDYPYAPRKTIERFAKELDEAGADDAAFAQALDRGNALKLFPRLNAQ